MYIDHVAIWTGNLEKMRSFYMKFFATKSSERYMNQRTGFSSYFLSFSSGARIELMERPDIVRPEGDRGLSMGYAHLSISVGSRKRVDELTESLKENGFRIKGKPRITGDGYYESVILDPEGNYLEIME